jgi:biopolymer transport protein TolQ
MGYNQLNARLREQAARLDDFGRELLNSIEDIHSGPAQLPPADEYARPRERELPRERETPRGLHR